MMATSTVDADKMDGKSGEELRKIGKQVSIATPILSNSVSKISRMSTTYSQSTLEGLLKSKRSMGDSMTADVSQPPPPPLEMHKVPQHMIGTNSKYYEPKTVSIGPYHHGDPKCMKFESIKSIAISKFFTTQDQDISTFLNELPNGVIQKWIRYYHNNDSNLRIKFENNENQFALMIIVDAIFILIFIEYAVLNQLDSLKIKINQAMSVRRDLFLLENQIPYQVIDLLLAAQAKMEKKEESILKQEWIKKLSKFMKLDHVSLPKESECASSFHELHHLLDVYHKSLVCGRRHNASTPDVGQESCYLQIFPRKIRETLNNFVKKSDLEPEGLWLDHNSAKELIAMGIRLKPSKSPYFNDIRFRSNCIGAVLKLPVITIDEATITMWMNLIAYETYYRPSFPLEISSSVTSYICFLDTLIDHTEDVQELRSVGVLHNFLGSNEDVAKLINTLASSFVMNALHFGNVKRDMTRYMRRSWKLKIGTWMAEAIRLYFRSPWSFLAVLTAIFLIFLSATQAYYRVFRS